MELEYQFTPQKLISEGRISEEILSVIRNYVENLTRKPVPKVIQDEMLILFLISCENDIELTKKTIIAFYDCKKNAPEIFDNRNMYSKEIQMAMNTVQMSSIPRRTDNNDVVHYFKLNDTNYQNFDLGTIMKTSYMLIDIAQERNPPNGVIVVIDSKGCSLMHLTKFKLGLIKKYIQFLQEGFPLKLREIHILNAAYLIYKIMDMVKMFMKSELLDLLHIHPPGLEQEKLFQLIPKECLPNEYGGDLPTVYELHNTTMEQFYAKQQFWDIEEQIRKSYH